MFSIIEPSRVFIVAATVLAALGSSVFAGSHEEENVLVEGEKYYLFCSTQSELLVDITFAINGESRRGRFRPHSQSRAQPTLGVRYYRDHIHLWPNRSAPNPPPTHFDIDRRTLVLTAWKPIYPRGEANELTGPSSDKKNVLGAAQCRFADPEPELMPSSRRWRFERSDQ